VLDYGKLLMAIEEPDLTIVEAGDCTKALREGLAEGDTDILAEANFYDSD